ncbi:DNA polymerase Y family protein [Mucilaginibacter sp. KACC 22063]|uniref:DNA polymerase Y family protein n=1 Tax=Mucilaginibacter sp. KACC 22063 TaxID=3025666 RepID=UPI0023650F2C|nr:DNA polymerase IV [Mucilaginibacter sp. KACC 22063]WDF53467.1 DNA polymerase IV [Mucilaginibacter sp. KACC 22063]
MNQNSIHAKTEARVLFVDMDSFFARCEQQVNYWLRNRPVGVCVYTGKYGCVISLSKEAKALGIKAGTRLNDVMELCPDFVPIESNPTRYREFHVRIISVLQRYCQEVVPKSIDEAIINLTDYKLVHPDPVKVARQIKQDILNEVGDWLTCSVGIAPNAFLAKLGSVIGKKGDGLQVIDHDNIDDVLRKLKLGDLPGIGKQMCYRLERNGVNTPLEMRYTSAQKLKAIFKSIEGIYWHYRLNFIETNIVAHDYKGMQSMRQVSKDKRENPEYMQQLFLTLCCTLEKRMVRHKFYCKAIGFSLHYVNGDRWEDGFRITTPVQDAISLMNMIKLRISQFEEKTKSAPVFNNQISSIRIAVTDFIENGHMLYSLFEDMDQKETARKTMHAIKDRFGYNKIMRAVEMTDNTVIKDVIGFGSVKDLTDLDYATIPRYE